MFGKEFRRPIQGGMPWNGPFRKRAVRSEQSVIRPVSTPKSIATQSTRPDDTRLSQRLGDFVPRRRGFGRRGFHLHLEREGVQINWKKLYRLNRVERLTVRNRGGRTPAPVTTSSMANPQEPNQRRSPDLVSDALTDRGGFRVLCVIDDFSRERLAAVADSTMPGCLSTSVQGPSLARWNMVAPALERKPPFDIAGTRPW